MRIKSEHTEWYRQIGKKISYYRKLRGLTQEQLAESADIHLTFLGAIEAPNMEKAVSLDTLFDIAKVLNVPPYKLMQFEED